MNKKTTKKVTKKVAKKTKKVTSLKINVMITYPGELYPKLEEDFIATVAKKYNAKRSSSGMGFDGRDLEYVLPSLEAARKFKRALKKHGKIEVDDRAFIWL